MVGIAGPDGTWVNKRAPSANGSAPLHDSRAAVT
jgi:hypothetical protein